MKAILTHSRKPFYGREPATLPTARHIFHALHRTFPASPRHTSLYIGDNAIISIENLEDSHKLRTFVPQLFRTEPSLLRL